MLDRVYPRVRWVSASIHDVFAHAGARGALKISLPD